MSFMPWLLPLMVFAAAFALAAVALAPLASGGTRRLRQRIDSINRSAQPEEAASLLREEYLRQLSPAERWLEALPGMRRIEVLCEQAGRHIPAYRVVMLSLALAMGAALIVLALGRPWLALLAFAIVLPLLYAKLVQERDARMLRFEEQLPDALDVMGRALRAGNPFNETMRMVAEEMDEPIATEFGITFADLNYGLNVKSAFLALLERVPNVSLAAVVTAVLVQRETGGNMAEIFDRIAGVLRMRLRFRRRLRTLSAEGRMSAWVLILMPFVLSLVLMIVAPDYLPVLIKDPFGIKLIVAALIVMTVGVWWIRRVIRVRF